MECTTSYTTTTTIKCKVLEGHIQYSPPASPLDGCLAWRTRPWVAQLLARVGAVPLLAAGVAAGVRRLPAGQVLRVARLAAEAPVLPGRVRVRRAARGAVPRPGIWERTNGGERGGIRKVYEVSNCQNKDFNIQNLALSLLQ